MYIILSFSLSLTSRLTTAGATIVFIEVKADYNLPTTKHKPPTKLHSLVFLNQNTDFFWCLVLIKLVFCIVHKFCLDIFWCVFINNFFSKLVDYCRREFCFARLLNYFCSFRNNNNKNKKNYRLTNDPLFSKHVKCIGVVSVWVAHGFRKVSSWRR